MFDQIRIDQETLLFIPSRGWRHTKCAYHKLLGLAQRPIRMSKKTLPTPLLLPPENANPVPGLLISEDAPGAQCRAHRIWCMAPLQQSIARPAFGLQNRPQRLPRSRWLGMTMATIRRFCKVPEDRDTVCTGFWLGATLQVRGSQR